MVRSLDKSEEIMGHGGLKKEFMPTVIGICNDSPPMAHQLLSRVEICVGILYLLLAALPISCKKTHHHMAMRTTPGRPAL